MKKTILSLLFAGTTLIGFSQEKVNGVEIKTEHLEPITYSSVE
jgi:hypothetical protein